MAIDLDEKYSRHWKRNWKTSFDTVRSLPGFVRLRTVASDTEFSPLYRNEGRLRQGEEYAVFQYSLSGEGIFENARSRYYQRWIFRFRGAMHDHAIF